MQVFKSSELKPYPLADLNKFSAFVVALFAMMLRFLINQYSKIRPIPTKNKLFFIFL